MPNQEIGVDSIFETNQFTRGLNRYLAGLQQATTATQTAATAINSFAATSNQAMTTILHTAQGTVRSINQLTAAIRAANAAAAASRVPRRLSNAAGALPLTPGGGQQTTTQVNQAAAATQRYGQAARRAQGDVRGLTTASGALAVAVGTLAANAIQRSIGGFISMGRSILETVTFFERLDLSIQFFSARSATAADASLTYEQALEQTAEQAEALSYWLQQLAIASPFTTRDVGTVFRTAQAYGLTRQEAELLTPLLLDFAAATGLTSDVLERLALAFGQVRSRGKLTGEEVRQLGNSGLPIRDILVKALNIANSEFDELLESGALTSDVVLPAIVNALKDFEGAGRRVSFETIGGLVSAFEELKEISTGTFFRGVLAPLTEEFQAFFKVVNRPQTLAFIKLLGQELGGTLLTAFRNLVAGVKGLVAQWQALDPIMKQQILIFGATFAIVIALTAAIGLMVISIRLLTNPVILVASSIAFLVSEYSSGFAVLDSITGGFISRFKEFPRAIGNGIASAIRFVGSGVSAIGKFFAGLAGDMGGYGASIVSAFAEGAIGAANALIPIFNEIASLFTFWLAPGSPPRIVPNIDEYGRDTMQEYLNSFAEANPEIAFDKAGNIIADSLTKLNEDVLSKFNQLNPEAEVNQYGVVLTKGITEGLNKASKAARDGIGPALASDEVLSAASNAGIQASQAYVDSFVENMIVLIPPMSEELREIMDQIGKGRQLSLSGAFAFNQFLDGFKLADFDILDEATGVVQSVLSSLVEIGELDEIDLARQVFGSSEAIAKAIEEFRRAGKITEGTLNDVSRSAGQAGGFVVDLLKNYQELARATDSAEAAQDELNRVTKQYDDLLKPLKQQLDAINETVAFKDEEERILSLRRLIANQAVSDRRKSTAQAQIDQILAERRVRNLETERDVAVDTAQETLKAREEEREALEEQFSILQARINAQLEQLSLVSQEGSIVNKLNEEAAKLRKKQLTETELQLELLRLQGEEVADTVKAAKAKFVLDQADSTELEKQQAILDLQEVALNRRNRILEAAKFGIPASELTKFRDLVVTLDDIGEKGLGKDKFTSDLSAITEGLVDVKSITEQIDAATAEVRKRWEEVKEQIRQTLAEINANLPSFLRIFPTEEGGTIPLVNTLIMFANAIKYLAIYMVSTRIASLLFRFGKALAFVFNLVKGAGAAGAAGGAAGAGGAAAAGAGLSGFVAGILSLGAAALLVTGYLVALREAMDLFRAGEEQRFTRNTEQISSTLGDAGPAIQENTEKLLEQLEPVTEAARTRLQETITSAVTQAITDGLGDEHVAASVGNALNRAVAEGLIVDTEANRGAIEQFQQTLLDTLTIFPTDKKPVLDPLKNAEIVVVPTEEAAAQAHTEFGNFLAGITDKEQASTFATAIQTLVADATALGMKDAQIDTLVFGAFNEGVKAGLVADTPENKKAIQTYVDELVKQMQAAAEIESPSKLSQREFGEPWGEGIVEGIKASLGIGPGSKSALADALKVILASTKSTATQIKTELVTNFGAARTAVIADVFAIKTTAILQFNALVTSVTTSLSTLHRNISSTMRLIKGVVVNSFVTMRIESEVAISEMITSVIELFAGKEDSLLANLRLAFLGVNQIVPRQIGLDFMEGIGLGILEGQDDLTVVMARAISGAVRSAGNSITPNLRVNAGTQPLSSRPSLTTPGNVSNVMRTQNFYLNVETASHSQGVINDFGIMRTMAGG